MFDSHCHLTDARLAPQADALLARAAAAGVQRLVTIGTDPADAQAAIVFCRSHPQVRCAVGLAVGWRAESLAQDILALRALAREPQVLALGEMGLDYHYEKFTPRAVQQAVFEKQLELARETGLPLVIHCRKAVDDCLAMLGKCGFPRGVFHCFDGTQDEARRILDAGYLLGFTGIVTFATAQALREVVACVPVERMLLETDAPCLSPEPVRRQRTNEPAHLVHTAAKIAELKHLSVRELDDVTTRNAQRLFGWR